MNAVCLDRSFGCAPRTSTTNGNNPVTTFDVMHDIPKVEAFTPAYVRRSVGHSDQMKINHWAERAVLKKVHANFATGEAITPAALQARPGL